MRSAVILLTMVAVAGAADARSVTDSAGRTVTIPETVQRVYAAGPPAAVLLYVLAPDRLIGWPRALSREDERYLPEAYRGLPRNRPAHGAWQYGEPRSRSSCQARP